jgi:hypothetical protein
MLTCTNGHSPRFWLLFAIYVIMSQPLSEHLILPWNIPLRGARGSLVAWGNTLQAERSRVRIPMRSLDFSSRTMALGSTQPLTEISTRNFSGGKGLQVREAGNPHRHLWADSLENVGASTSHNPVGLHGLLQDSFTLFYCSIVWVTLRETFHST